MQLSLFVTLLLRLLVACSSLRFCLAAPTNATVSRDLFKRGYIPSDQECDDALKANNFNGKAIFHTRGANPAAWRTKLGYLTLLNAYGGDYLARAAGGPGPLAGVQNSKDPMYTPIFDRLSAGFARAAQGDAYIAMNRGAVADAQSVWIRIELPILMARPQGKIFLVMADDLNQPPLQTWPPGAPGGPIIPPNSQ